MSHHITFDMNGTGSTEEHSALSCRFRPVEQRLYWQVERLSLDWDRGRRWRWSWRGLSSNNRLGRRKTPSPAAAIPNRPLSSAPEL